MGKTFSKEIVIAQNVSEDSQDFHENVKLFGAVLVAYSSFIGYLKKCKNWVHRQMNDKPCVEVANVTRNPQQVVFKL